PPRVPGRSIALGEGRLRRPEPVAGGSEPSQGSGSIDRVGGGTAPPARARRGRFGTLPGFRVDRSRWGRDGSAGPSPSREVRNPPRVPGRSIALGEGRLRRPEPVAGGSEPSQGSEQNKHRLQRSAPGQTRFRLPGLSS